MLHCAQATVKQHLSAEEARAQAAELLRKAKLKREKEEAETARIREREVRMTAVHLQLLYICNCCTLIYM
jgi:hypothetical protein